MSKARQPKFKLGDLVYLVSGGPEMAIKEVKFTFRSDEFTGEYDCQWFAGKKLERGTFPEESLTNSNPKP